MRRVQPLWVSLTVAAIFAAVMASTTVPTPLYPIYEREFGLSSLQITVVFAVYGVGVMTGLFVFGRLSDHSGRKPPLAGGLVVGALAMVLFLLAQEIGLLLAGRFLIGITAGLYTGTATAWLVDLDDNRDRATKMAIAANLGGLAMGPLLAGLLAQYVTAPLRTAYVVDDTQPEGQALAAAFTDEWRLLGGQVTGQVSVPAGTTSYVNVLTQASVTRPDLIFYGGDAATGAISLRQQMLQVPGLKNTVFVGGDGAHTAAFAQAIGSTSTTYSATAGPDGSDDPGFRTRFVTRFGAGSISTYSAAAYDATMILLHAIITARSGGTLTRPAVLAAVAATNYQGTGATWSFDVTGGPATRIVTIYTPAPANLSQGDGWQYVTSICPTC